MNVDGIETYLDEFKRESYGKYDVVTVGEANGVSAEQAVDWVDENRGVFNMIFQFETTHLWAKTVGILDGTIVNFVRNIFLDLCINGFATNLYFVCFSSCIETYYDPMAKEFREKRLECSIH
jgi:hypothetical protein